MAADPSREGVGASAPAPGSGVPHGTASAYSYHKWRCQVCVEYKRAVDRAYYAKNQAKVRAKVGEYRAANRDTIRQRNRDRYWLDPEAARAQKRESAARYAPQNVDRVREWRKLPHAKIARRLEAHGRRKQKFDAEARAYVLILLNDPCSYCGGPGGTIDHIVPIAAGGTSDWWNLAAACVSCNCQKSDLPLLRFLLRRLAARPTTPGHTAAA